MKLTQRVELILQEKEIFLKIKINKSSQSNKN